MIEFFLKDTHMPMWAAFYYMVVWLWMGFLIGDTNGYRKGLKWRDDFLETKMKEFEAWVKSYYNEKNKSVDHNESV